MKQAAVKKLVDAISAQNPVPHPARTIAVVPEKQLYNSFQTVRQHIANKKGSLVSGWLILVDNNFVIEAVPHAVWRNDNGVLVCLTKQSRNQTIFLEDARVTEEMQDHLYMPIEPNGIAKVKLHALKRLAQRYIDKFILDPHEGNHFTYTFHRHLSVVELKNKNETRYLGAEAYLLFKIPSEVDYLMFEPEEAYAEYMLDAHHIIEVVKQDYGH